VTGLGEGRRAGGVRAVRGFTLLEVIVGIAVGGVVLLAGFAALATVHDRSTHTLEAMTPTVEGAGVRATLVAWLSGAQLRAEEIQTDFQFLPARDTGADSDELTFPTRAPTPLEVPVTEVRLRVVEAPEGGPGATLLVAELRYGIGDEPLIIPLVPGIRALRILCYPNEDGARGWEEDCTPSLQQLPRGIELRLETDHPERLPPLLRYPIRVAFPVVL
jgi:prepilin-type N-terminal cleavage/methylation domain-containing protein